MNSNIYAHPSMCTTPELIWALQDRLGMRAVIEGRRVRLEPMPSKQEILSFMEEVQVMISALHERLNTEDEK